MYLNVSDIRTDGPGEGGSPPLVFSFCLLEHVHRSVVLVARIATHMGGLACSLRGTPGSGLSKVADQLIGRDVLPVLFRQIPDVFLQLELQILHHVVIWLFLDISRKLFHHHLSFL